MPDDLVVHLNRAERHAVEPADSSLAVAGGFEVVIENHGDGSHVNLGLDGDLAAGGAVATPNPFVPANETVRIPVDITTDHRPLEGVLRIATGYGQTQVEIPVSVVSARKTGVDADPSPARANGGRSTAAGLPADLEDLAAAADDPATLALVALAVLALTIAVAAAVLIDSLVVVLAVVLVVLAVAGTLGTLLRS